MLVLFEGLSGNDIGLRHDTVTEVSNTRNSRSIGVEYKNGETETFFVKNTVEDIVNAVNEAIKYESDLSHVCSRELADVSYSTIVKQEAEVRNISINIDYDKKVV